MTEAEYEFAATNSGTTEYPWGNDGTIVTQWPFDAVGTPVFDRTLTNPAVLGLYSNVAEWTSSRSASTSVRSSIPAKAIGLLDELNDRQAVRGGSYSVVQGKAIESELQLGPRYRHLVLRNMTHPGLGIRGARSVAPELLTVEKNH
jgi:formylglycine-generating enzyme required for sulfatase activity